MTTNLARPNQTNNSDDEDDRMSNSIAPTDSIGIPTTINDDFVSFPTIPDPELENSQSLGRIISKTFRKATANASNLVNLSKKDLVAPVEVRPKSPRKLQSMEAEPPTVRLTTPEEESSHSVIDDYKNARVTSDNKSLRLSTLPQRNPTTNTITNSFFNVNAHTINEKAERAKKQNARNSALKKKGSALLNRISSIFNNLPNDIELSDDSASDLETINNEEIPVEEKEDGNKGNNNIEENNSKSFASATATNTPTTPTASQPKRFNYNSSSYYDFSLYSESTARASPIKAELKRSTSNHSVGDSKTLSSFYALKTKDMKKKTSSNLSTVLFDNAKAIIPQEIKKKKRKPKRDSNNPLKNGGIPRVYWMNDSFVLDCLNCFKPFSAFRRKHHCRFCGQIFCSDCTLFISYNQHKEERKNLHVDAKKTYSDKLRVCKPCYSDVIVYLSDDSSEDEADVDKSVNKVEEDVVANHPLARIRSVSISSRRDSLLMNDSKIESFKETTPIMESAVMVNQSPIVKIYPRLAPKMAIPTTRTGEAVEIPATRNHNVGSNFTLNVPALTNHTHLHSNHYLHHHQHANNNVIASNANGSNSNTATPSSSWFMAYGQKRPNTSAPDLPSSNSFDNISNILLGRSTLTLKLRVKEREAETEFPDISLEDDATDRESVDSDSDSEDAHSSNINESQDEIQEEDEQVMSVYTSLNHSYSGGIMHSPKPTAAVMPTLGEFPSMYVADKKLAGDFSIIYGDKKLPASTPTFSKIFLSSNTVPVEPMGTFLEEIPKSESLRSRERAHASLERMKSRRRTKSARNISILSNSSYRLPSSQYQPDNQPQLLPINYPQKNYLQRSKTEHKYTPPNILGDSLSLVPFGLDSDILQAQGQPQVQFQPDLLLISLDTPQTMQRSRPQSQPISTLNQPPSPTVEYNIAYLPASNDIGLSPKQGFMDLSFASMARDLMSPNSLMFDKENTRPKEEVYSELLDFVLRQSLEDCDVKENQATWMRVLKETLSHINVLKLTDTLDIRQYVKVKKNLGGTIEETKVINGLFMTKNIDLKRMSFSVSHPKIALLMFPIEYLKQKEQFISLRIIHSQQSVYITNLVSRLVSLEPDIIVVGDSVCGLAHRLLEEAGITVMSNVKPQVIERISRYTKADIFQSVNDLFFKKGTLGTCERFEVKKYAYRNVIKTYSFFTGNEIETGFTIALRGGNEDLLNSIKYAAETLMPGYLNARFEKSLFDNSMITFRDTNENHKVKEVNLKLAQIEHTIGEEELLSCEFSLDSTEALNYVKFFNERRLSLSPASNFSLPTQLVKVIDSYYLFHMFFKKNRQIQDLESPEDIDELWLQEMKINIDPNTLPNLRADLLNFLKYTSDFHLRTLVNDYHTRARVWSNCMGSPSYQLYPVFHKNIHVLHSTVSIKHATPCSGPNIVIIDYYTDNDKCLGLFLDQTYHDSLKTCEDCGETFLDHYKTYVHGNAKLDLIIEKLDSRSQIPQHFQGKDQRVMWSQCKEEGCGYTTPITPMNDDTYYLSIGKFLELCFYGENVVVSDHACNHDYFQSHVRCFGFNDMFIRLEYLAIDSYEVVAPRKQLEFMPEVDIKLKVETFNNIKTKTTMFFESISKRLNRVKLDTYDKAEEGLLRIEELKSKVGVQLEEIEKRTLEIYNLTIPTNHLSLNSILRELQDLGVSWDNEFNDFEKRFLPSEHEITKITQFHLRNFFMDKYGSDPKDPDPKDPEDPKEELKELKDELEVRATEADEQHEKIGHEETVSPTTSEPDHLVINKAKTKEIGQMIPTSLYDSNILDRISRIEQMVKLEKIRQEGIKKLPPPEPLRHLTTKYSDTSLNEGRSVAVETPNKVLQLKTIFDDMNAMNEKISVEFKKERELQMKKLHKYRAIPILDSKPIVEIYDKIEDVVYVDERKQQEGGLQDRTAGATPSIVMTPAMTPAISDMNSLTFPFGIPKEKLSDIPQPEKISLLKSLTNFWADRSATLWDPLEYPLELHEHTFADSDVIVREDEPSSLIAFCLSSADYKLKISTMESETNCDNWDDEGFDLENNEINNKKINNFVKIEKKFKKKKLNGDTHFVNKWEKLMNKNKLNHLKYQFVDGSTNLSCKIFYSEQFEAFRKTCGNNDHFIQSLSRCIKWNSSGGKSGSNFLKTLDDRYIVKELSKSELDLFVLIAPFYFKYIAQSMFNTLTTAIAKIFGFYQIHIKNNITGKVYKMDFLIMENLFYNHKTTRIFDLKGSMRNRHVQQTGKENEVLLDENMIEYIYESPVFVKEQLKKLLRGSLFNDTSFLLAMDVMDYSLVVGIDSETKKLYIGIIDWLRTFTWDKKVENWVKGNNLIGGKKGKDPTIVTPKQYRTRFREAMERYLLEVPDIWYEGEK